MPDLRPVYEALVTVMRDNASGMVVADEKADAISLNAPWPDPKNPRRPMFFGQVKLGKAAVAFHLMPLYTDPAIAMQVPAGLRGRMQGKSCFNFKTTDEALFGDLAEVTRLAAEAYAAPPGGM